MPELPEVETLCRQLQDSILDQKIIETRVLDHKIKTIKESEGRRIVGVERHGKWLSLKISGGLTCQFHLRMTGRLFFSSEGNIPKHTRLIIRVGHNYLYLVDPRRFATVTLYREGALLTQHGPDALPMQSPHRLFEASQKHRISVKTFLLDQKAIAGIGNIYASEILHAAGVDPLKGVQQVSLREWKAITKAASGILKQAIDCRGTSISDWRDLFGQRGEFQDRLQVYGKSGSLCPRCGASILRVQQSGRSTFYCSCCQK